MITRKVFFFEKAARSAMFHKTILKEFLTARFYFFSFKENRSHKNPNVPAVIEASKIAILD